MAENGVVDWAARGSGRASLTISSRRERNRVSRKNRPWADVDRMSPLRSEMQNDEPCTRVTAPSAWPNGALAPEKVQGSAMGRG